VSLFFSFSNLAVNSSKSGTELPTSSLPPLGGLGNESPFPEEGGLGKFGIPELLDVKLPVPFEEGGLGNSGKVEPPEGGVGKSGIPPLLDGGDGKSDMEPLLLGGDGKSGIPPLLDGGDGKSDMEPLLLGGDGKFGIPPLDGGLGKSGNPPLFAGGEGKSEMFPLLKVGGVGKFGIEFLLLTGAEGKSGKLGTKPGIELGLKVGIDEFKGKDGKETSGAGVEFIPLGGSGKLIAGATTGDGMWTGSSQNSAFHSKLKVLAISFRY